jgi:hypothetical protein
MDWRQAAAIHGVTVEELKEDLPIEWVISVSAGIALDEVGEGRAIGVCPFHDDEDPSLDVYGYGTRWGCFPCGQGGDIFDFIGAFWELESFTARFEKGVQLLQAYKEEDEWSGIVKADGPAIAVSDAEVYTSIREAQENFHKGVQYPLAQLLSNKGLDDIPPFWLNEVWGVGVTHNNEILAPYYDDGGEVISYKTRYAGRGGWYAKKGRPLTALYGEWMLKDEQRVWLCEGETDTWLASYLLRGRGVALGLPRGAGAHVDDRWVKLLKGRTVTLVFDADAAGRRAARKWYAALNGVADEIHISFPDSDLCDTSDPVFTLDNGITVTPATGFVSVRPDAMCYQQINRQGAGEDLNDWVLEPTKYIRYLSLGDETVATGYEGHFTDDKGKRLLITSGDLKNGASAVDWSNKNRRVWFAAGSKWTQGVLSLMNESAPFLPRVDAVSRVGLHGMDRGTPVFVMPTSLGTTIGSAIAKEQWVHYDEGSMVDYGQKYELKEENLTPEQIKQWAFPLVSSMLDVNRRDVTTPIIAWLAACPLRATVTEFPSLAVLGGSGSGKTSLLAEYLRAWYGLTEEHNLSRGSTPYGLTQWALGTNALPVWYDEYRNQARPENLDMVDQLLRDAWTASSSSRGGYGEDKTKVRTMKVTAPIVVSGESEFEERSHIDRAIILKLPDKNAAVGRNVAQFKILTQSVQQPGRLGRLYMEWVAHELSTGACFPPERALDRQEQGNRILQWGWSLFTRFSHEVLGVDGLGELELNRAEEARDEADEHAVLTALADAIESKATDRNNRMVAWIQEPGDQTKLSVIAARPHQFYQWATQNGYRFPGNSSATRSWLKQRFTVVSGRTGRVQYQDVFEGRIQVRGIEIVGVLEAIEKDIHA